MIDTPPSWLPSLMDNLQWLQDPRTLLAVAVAVAGWASAVISWRGSRTAHKQLRIASSQEARKSPSLELYLIEASREVQTEHYLYVFTVILRNLSDSPNSIATIDLDINYKTSQGTSHTLRIPHVPSITQVASASHLRKIYPATPIGPRDTVQGSIVFEVSRRLTKPMIIDDYRLVIQGTHNNKVSVSAILPREVLQEGVRENADRLEDD